MLLTAGPAFEFAKFMQIVSWIVLPIFCFTVAITVWLHYRRKKKLNIPDGDDSIEKLIAVPESTAYKISDTEYIFFDHSALIREYKNKLVFNHARYTALRHDFNRLERKYSAFLKHTEYLPIKKTDNMENSNALLQHSFKSEADNALNEYGDEKNELRHQLDELNKLYQALEKENNFMQDKLVLLTATDDERAAIIHRWEEENAGLKDRLAEQEYLKDIVEEKKRQIDFLQQQLEQRIKNQHHQTEHQRSQISAELEQFKEHNENVSKQIALLKNELLLKQEEIDKSQMTICEKEEQLENSKQVLASKEHHIIVLENVLRETKQQNELLNAAIADSNDLAVSLKEQLVNEQSKISSLEQKLESNKKVLKKLYKEISSSMNTEEESPVIELKPAYINNERQEWGEKGNSIVIA